jgi:hypothetical protein
LRWNLKNFIHYFVIRVSTDAVSQKFRGLSDAFKAMHRLKYAQYIERVEAGLKSQIANLKRNSNGYSSAMFLSDACTRNVQEII